MVTEVCPTRSPWPLPRGQPQPAPSPDVATQSAEVSPQVGTTAPFTWVTRERGRCSYGHFALGAYGDSCALGSG